MQKNYKTFNVTQEAYDLFLATKEKMKPLPGVGKVTTSEALFRLVDAYNKQHEQNK